MLDQFAAMNYDDHGGYPVGGYVRGIGLEIRAVALEFLNQRTQQREARGVEGAHKR